MRDATASAPCTVGNFGPGFDVFSLALDRVGDTITLAPAEADAVSIHGPGADRIPAAWSKNAACAVLDAARAMTGETAPLEVSIQKGVPPGSGLGSSASSCAAALRAFVRLHDVTLRPADALRLCAMGEAVATGSAHTDDVAAALYGGLTIVGGHGDDSVVRLKPPPLHLVVARPDVELATRAMRALIPAALPRPGVVQNLSNVARIVHACHTQDAKRLCRALDDTISAANRGPKVPGFERLRVAAREAGAMGFLLSGSGPACIAALPGDASPRLVEAAMRDALAAEKLSGEVFVTRPHKEVDDPALPLS